MCFCHCLTALAVLKNKNILSSYYPLVHHFLMQFQYLIYIKVGFVIGKGKAVGSGHWSSNTR